MEEINNSPNNNIQEKYSLNKNMNYDIYKNSNYNTNYNSKLYLYDLSNLENNKKLCNEVNTTIWGAKFFPHERDIFVSLGGDGNLNFYNYDKNLFINNNNDKLNVVAYNNICSSPIIGFDWHLIKNGLACLISLDNTVRICKCENF